MDGRRMGHVWRTWHTKWMKWICQPRNDYENEKYDKQMDENEAGDIFFERIRIARSQIKWWKLWHCRNCNHYSIKRKLLPFALWAFRSLCMVSMGIRNVNEAEDVNDAGTFHSLGLWKRDENDAITDPNGGTKCIVRCTRREPVNRFNCSNERMTHECTKKHSHICETHDDDQWLFCSWHYIRSQPARR